MFALLAIAAAPGLARAQGKDMVIEGQVKAGVHKLKLETGTLYQFEVKAKEFEPSVTMIGSFIPNTVQFGKERNTFRGVFFPPKNGDYSLYILPNIGFNPKGGLLDYTLTVKTMKVDETPLLKKEDKLTADDPKYANPQVFNKTHHKVYPIKVTAGKTYIIDMVAAKADGNKLDPYLYLEAPNKNVVARDDDSGGFPNARIIFTATMDGEYRVVASALSDTFGVGDYTLTVRTVKDEK
jgi:hypothetical protein